MLLLGLILLGKQKPTPFHRAIYHWKSSFARSTYDLEENKFFEAHGIRKMYLKMLDVDYSEAGLIIPVGKTRIDYYISPEEDSLEYVPVVYISNRVFQYMPTQDIDYYAKLFLEHTLRIETYTNRAVREVQIDCDWTEGTKDKYFLLLQRMRYWMPNLKYSVTLRLYPFKYRTKLGVPPANRVMLMMYNLENAKKMELNNSLFDPNLAAKYVTKTPYPLPMDFAIPAFSWSLLFRHGQFLRVFSDNILEALESEKARYVGVKEGELKYRKLGYNKYLIEETPDFYNDYDLRAGDILKIESCGADELKQASALITRFHPRKDATIAIFDFDLNELNKITYEDLEAAYTPLH